MTLRPEVVGFLEWWRDHRPPRAEPRFLSRERLLAGR
jgi:hypothetical protein